MNSIRTLSYQEWSEAESKVVRTILEQTVSNEELFVRKLVNATVIRNQCFEHTSHESEDGQRQFIYMKPFQEMELKPYGSPIKHALFEYCDIATVLAAEWHYWERGQFNRGEPLRPAYQTLELAQLLLDHYYVERGHTYEHVYSVLDLDRRKVNLFLKGVDV